MKRSTLLLLLLLGSGIRAQDTHRNLPYVKDGHDRQVLDVYTPPNAKNAPVVFWIHGGGWQTGDKKEVQLKPRYFTDMGLVFVAPNYRLLPSVDMETLIGDVAEAVRWVDQNIARYGGDPSQLLIMGHSAGAQLAALLCTDDRYLKKVNVSLQSIRGCVPVDGDTYDIPAIIATAEARWKAHGLPFAKFGHREKFGNDPEKHKNFSAVNHVAAGKSIPPFLILYVGGHPDVSAQATRLGNVLKEAGQSVTLHGARETTHSRINEDLGKEGDPCTQAVTEFVKRQLKLKK